MRIIFTFASAIYKGSIQIIMVELKLNVDGNDYEMDILQSF